MNFLALTKARFSVRKYEPTRQLEKTKLDYVMECVRMAPSAVNYQSWRFHIISLRRKTNWRKSTPVMIAIGFARRRA